MSNVVGPSALGYHLSRKVCQDILTILTMYTSSGVWQEMVKEVFKYIPSAPHTYMPGLEILSQLLPLPLPMQTQSLLTGTVRIQILNTQIPDSSEYLPGRLLEFRMA